MLIWPPTFQEVVRNECIYTIYMYKSLHQTISRKDTFIIKQQLNKSVEKSKSLIFPCRNWKKICLCNKTPDLNFSWLFATGYTNIGWLFSWKAICLDLIFRIGWGNKLFTAFNFIVSEIRQVSFNLFLTFISRMELLQKQSFHSSGFFPPVSYNNLITSVLCLTSRTYNNRIFSLSVRFLFIYMSILCNA